MFKKFLRALNQHLEEYLIALFLIAESSHSESTCQ